MRPPEVCPQCGCRFAAPLPGAGQAAISRTTKGAIFPTNHNLRIGGEESFNSRLFDGFIDELAVYGRALSASGTQAIFNAGSAISYS